MKCLHTLFKKQVLFILVGFSYVSATVVSTSPPTSEVKVQSYDYVAGKSFTGKIYVKNIDLTKVVSVIYSDATGDWNNNANLVKAAFSESISDTSYEFWTFSSSTISSIKEFYIKYDVSGKTYYDNNGSANYVVTTPPPTTTTSFSPTSTATETPPTSTSTAFPSGNSTISTWIKTQEGISRSAMIRNINPPGAAKGFIAASLSTSGPDYYYSWTRDSALVSYVMANDYNTTLKGDTTTVGLLKDYVTYSINAQSTSTACNCLGEPKFNADGSSFTGAWGRPQNDGPAERASSFILIADSILKQSGDDTYVTGTLKPAIFKDLDYVVSTWSDGCFDLWEEANGVHFYTLMVMRKGLIHGANFATRNGDATRASTYTTTANTLKTKIDTFWSGTYITVTQSLTGGVQKAGYDVSTLIAANSGSLADGFYTPGSDKILATAVVVESKFSSLYDINVNAPSYLGTAIGRYPEDTYNGNGNGQGNPWYLATSAYAELYYRAIKEWTLAGQVTVSSISLPFFKKFDTAAAEGTVYKVGTAAFTAMTQNVALGADKFLSTVKNYALTNGSMSEQYERGSGKSTGARDLTWSHAALISAARAKAGAPSA
ncbi:hypothetical protein INT47_008652 [Mucor saturninus]|uniref:glucan 1,4-alpha-glucosidase n=1 Tax=Mucor saturninus TaxID=64648 RepID=A0A8H7QKN3_9FUNG|nr:hypothetical protein INT47_008652 [Mucor saturninus]